MKTRLFLIIGMMMLAIASSSFVASAEEFTSEWLHWGYDLQNTKHNASETTLSQSNVKNLEVEWEFDIPYATGVPGIPAVTDDMVYFSDKTDTGISGTPIINNVDSTGHIWAVDRETGEEVWSRPATDIFAEEILFPGSGVWGGINNHSRTVTVYEDKLIIGSQIDKGILVAAAVAYDQLQFPISQQLIVNLIFWPGPGAEVAVLDRYTGETIDVVTLDEHPAAMITMSPTVHNDILYVGTSSWEEILSSQVSAIQGLSLADLIAIFGGDIGPLAGLLNPVDIECCKFRGSMAAIDLNALNPNNADSTKILWQTSVLPELPSGEVIEEWYTGNAIWGSSPVVDLERESIYVATGNNYEALDTELEDCFANASSEADKIQCLTDFNHPDNHFNAIVAFDMNDGHIKWSRKTQLYDSWITSCPPLFWGDPSTCPTVFGPDFDFGQAPMLISYYDNTLGEDVELLVAGQKSGLVWAVDPENGDVVWTTTSGPGGLVGGSQWGSAFDGERIYVQNSNSYLSPFDYTKNQTANEHNNKYTEAGLWSALDPKTGDVLWRTPVPDGGFAIGPVTVANGVLYAASSGEDSHLYALNAVNGSVIWSMPTEGCNLSGPAIADGHLYWGSGYTPGFGCTDVPEDGSLDKFKTGKMMSLSIPH